MPPTVVNLAPTLTPSQVPTPTFVSKIENYEPVTAIKRIRRRRDTEASKGHWLSLEVAL